ncbi:MAG: sensor histidine kinase KdpD [Deltaproteobacteria bacterium]|nr:sensor histidine kinase KdpD [Deltaproteobacteria bacterium]
MEKPSDRPDPDALLRRMREEETRAKRGKLKIFFGFAPGVGKTYRMLQVARDLAAVQRVDVVLGVVEDHRRTETACLVLGLETLPRRRVQYRGHEFEEFDLDAALSRKPQLLLLDELAHTNVPGSRHPKRWQDVDELIEAGIDVLTTMNVQHVESLNDVVTQISGIHVRETVPDSVLDRADAIELVDIAPEELLERLEEGKVYLPEQAKRAARHFFRRGNLLALRELALRRTAQHVDEDVQEYREKHGVAVTWPAGERILVCVGPAPSSGRLIRAAARMAAGLRCPWVASYVESTTARPMSKDDEAQLEVHLRVAETLGATVTRLSGPDVSLALLEYARKHNVTRLIIGKPTHSRLRDRLRGSLLDDVVRGSGDIDVHVISGDSTGEALSRNRGAPVGSAPVRHYVSATFLVLSTLGLALLLRSVMDLPDLVMLFLLAVMVAAVWFGRGPSILAAALGVASYDFFLVPPSHTFSVDDRRYFLTFGMMFAVSFAMSELTGRLRRQQRDAEAREERTAVLYALTRELASTDEPTRIAAIAARHAADIFSAKAIVLGVLPDGEWRAVGASPEGFQLDEKGIGVAKWSYEHDTLAGLGTDALPGADTLSSPLRAGQSRLGVLALVPRAKTGLRGDQRAFLDVLCRQVAVALERARLSDEAKQSALRAKTEEMRSSLLSAVSHDLRTPLASITGAATSLRDDANLGPETRRELVDAIVDQAERLERLVANLLDMTRLESGGISLRRDWVPIDEMVGSALTRQESRLGPRKVTVAIAPDVPLVSVDPVLFEQVFVNLLENIEKYTPPGSAIEIAAQSKGERVEIDVRDHGPGLPPGAETRVFDKFYRGPHVGVSGAGLGLPICRGIVEAHGGTISAETRSTGGAAFHISIPRGGTPPSLSPHGGNA